MTKYKKGQDLFCVYADDETGTCELWLYKVRTIRAGFVFAIRYEKDWTWVKLSNKNGDWGWAKNIDPLCRDRTPIGKDFSDLHTTKLKAWKHALKESNGWRKKYFEDGMWEKATKTMKRMITRNKRKKKNV